MGVLMMEDGKTGEGRTGPWRLTVTVGSSQAE